MPYQETILTKSGISPMHVVLCPAGKLHGDDVAASIRKNFAQNLRKLIDDSGLRDKDVAKACDISPSRLSKWLSQSAFSEDAFDLLRDKMGWTYEQLVRDPVTVSSNDLVEVVKRLAGDAGYELVKRKH